MEGGAEKLKGNFVFTSFQVTQNLVRKFIEAQFLCNNKGLVIFNTAVGGWSRGEGFKNIWILALGGLKISFIFFEWG